jgi:hypothetical protein
VTNNVVRQRATLIRRCRETQIHEFTSICSLHDEWAAPEWPLINTMSALGNDCVNAGLVMLGSRGLVRIPDGAPDCGVTRPLVRVTA